MKVEKVRTLNLARNSTQNMAQLGPMCGPAHLLVQMIQTKIESRLKDEKSFWEALSWVPGLHCAWQIPLQCESQMPPLAPHGREKEVRGMHPHKETPMRIPRRTYTCQPITKRTRRSECMHKNLQILYDRSITSWDDPHFSLCLCETMVSIQECGLASGLTAQFALFASSAACVFACHLVFCSDLFAAPGGPLHVLHPRFIWATSHSHNEPQHCSPPHRPA